MPINKTCVAHPYLLYNHFCEFLLCMKQVLTLVIKLQVDISQRQLLIDTANAFASACNWINQNVNPNYKLMQKHWQYQLTIVAD